MSDEVTQDQATDATQDVMGNNLTREEMQNEFYIRDLIKTYLDKLDNQRDRDRYVTFARGIIQEMQLANNGQPLGRSGEYSYRAAFDLAWEGMFGEPNEAKASEEEPKEEVKEKETVTETPKQATPTGVPPTPTKRTPGDIQPVQEGDEMESYVEKLGLANYAKARQKLHKMTKTLKTTQASEKGLSDIMKELDAD